MNMKSERGFSNGAAVIMVLLAFICIFPVLLLFMSSITSEASLLKNGYSVFPEEFGFDAYRYLWMSREKILRAYGMTIAQTAVGTSLSVVVTTLLAYPLSRKDLPGRNVIAFYIFLDRKSTRLNSSHP